MWRVLFSPVTTTLANLLDYLSSLVLWGLGWLCVAGLLMFLCIARYILGLIRNCVWVGGVHGALYFLSNRGVRWVVSLHTSMLTMLGGVVDRIRLVTREDMVTIQQGPVVKKSQVRIFEWRGNTGIVKCGALEGKSWLVWMNHCRFD